MNKTENKLVPELRFPDFINDSEWEEKELKKFGKFYRGLTYNSADVSEKGLLVLRSGNIQNNSLVFNKDLVFVNKNCTKDQSLKNKDIVICMSNGSKALVGKNAEYKGDYPNPLTVGAFCSIFRPINEFTKYLLQTTNYEKYISLRIGGGNINNLRNSDLEIFTSYVPKEFKEQQKIADCLSSLDEALTSHDEKLETLKNHKKGLLQNLFPQEGETIPKYRFPEFKNDGEWKKIELDKLTHSISSGKDKNSIEGKYKLYGSTGIIGTSNIPSYSGHFILVARVGANAGLLNKVSGNFGVTDNTLVIHLKKLNTIDFIFYSLEKTKLNNLVFGSGQPLITGSQLKNLKLLLPNSEKEQQKIAECLSEVDNLITAQTNKIEQLKAHKKGLMQRLFPNI